MAVNMKTLKIILRYSINSLEMAISNLPIFFLFTISKLIRYGLFIFFLYSLFNGLTEVAGYSRYQMLLFYLVFNLIDTTSQLLFREVYRFRSLIMNGGFDMVLTKPFSPLIRVLLGGPDMIDFGMLIIIVGVLAYLAGNFIHPNLLQIILFIGMVCNSLLLAAAFHICVLAIGILTMSVDHLVMIYRDLTSLMRIPVDVFTDPLRSILTFVIPVGIMFSFPAKVLFGLLSIKYVVIACVVSLLSFGLALKFWQHALTKYQSASS